MAKNWWFKLDFRVWRTDTVLRRCSLETRGFWLEMLCAMYEQGVFRITGTYEELGQLASCSESIAAKSCIELKSKNVADVTLGNGCVTLLSRRLKRELTSKENTRLRVRRHRSNADVTVQSNKKEVISNKKEEEKREEAATPPPALESVADDLAIQATEKAFNIRLDLSEKQVIVAAVPKPLVQYWPAFVTARSVGWANKPRRDKVNKISYVLTDFQKDHKNLYDKPKTEERLPTPAEKQAQYDELNKSRNAPPAGSLVVSGLQATGQDNPAISTNNY